MSLSPHLARWVWASVSKSFEDRRGWLYLFFEGDDRAIPEADKLNFAEFRMDGPRLHEVSRNYWQVDVYVNILIQTTMTNDTHAYFKTLGHVQSLYVPCIPVYRYGDGPDDDGSLVGFLQLNIDKPLEQLKGSNFGQVDQTVRLQQGTVEANYRMFLST